MPSGKIVQLKTARAPRPVRRQRGHGLLPAGFAWRDGRPIWNPSPTRRKQGWRALPLKDQWGNWLTRGAAIERAQAITEAVTAWSAGDDVPAAFLAIAPSGANPRAGEAGPRAIATLLADYYASPKYQGLAAKTRADYASKIGRLFVAIVGADDAVRLAKLKAMPIDILLPPDFGKPGCFELERAYDLLREEAGEHMAHGVLAAASAWLAWCVRKKRIWPSNPAELVERKTPGGRIVVFDWPEIIALVRAADALGLRSIGDAIILAVDLSWSQQDLLAMTWSQISADFHAKHRRIKTGVAGNPQLLPLGVLRLKEIAGRWPDIRQRPDQVLICERSGKPWAATEFRHTFAAVRAQAVEAVKLPDLAGKQFRDLRDTAITYGIDAGLTVEEICSRSLHEPARAQAVISKHYGAIRQGVADRAAEKLAGHFAAMGYQLEPVLALPAPKGNG